MKEINPEDNEQDLIINNDDILIKKDKDDIDINLININNTFSQQKPLKKIYKRRYSADYNNKRMIGNKERQLKSVLKENKDKYINLYNFKDYLMMLSLLLSSSFNFNLLYFPFIILGIFYSFLIYNNKQSKRDIKFILTIISLVYSILQIIFGIVVIILSKRKIDIIENNKTLFINLGIPYLLTESVFDLVKTLIGPVLMTIVSIIAIIFEKSCDFDDKDLIKKKRKDFPNLNSFHKKMNKYIFLSFLLIAAFANFNKSFLTMLYLVFFYFLLSILLKSTKEMLYALYKIILYIEIVFISCHLLIINITNVYSLYDNYFNINKAELKDSFLAKHWNKIGFYFAYYKDDDYFTPFIDWAGYCFGCISFVSFVFIVKDLVNGNYNEIRKKENKPKKNKFDIYFFHEKNEGIIKAKNKFNKLIENITNFCTSEEFLLNLIRILSIVFLYFIRSFFSLFVFIWLVFSFLYLDIYPIRIISIIILLPIIYVILICITTSRIFYTYYNELNNESKLKHFLFCLGNYDYDLIKFYALNIYYIIIICFIFVKKEKKSQIFLDKKNKENSRLDSFNLDSSDLINKKRFSNFEQNLLINNDDSSNDKLLLKDKIRTKNLVNEEDEEINLKNLVKKFIFIHLDKVTLLIMYFISNKEINLFHFIILIIFMIQLIKPSLIKNICIPILISLQSLFFIEYIFDLIKVYYLESLEKNLIKINFFFVFDINTKEPKTLFETSIEILIYLIIYFFYFHYILYNNGSYMKLSENKNITIANYIEIKIKNKTIKNILYKLGNIIKDIYTWGIIIIYVYFSCYFEINLIFAVNLIFFFICVYKFCVFIQVSRLDKVVKKSKEVTINLIFAIIVLFITGLHTVFSYLYQLLCHDFIGLKEKIENSENFFVKNLPTFGFTIYHKDNLYMSLLPHFILSFLSLLFFRIILGILEEESKEKMKHNELIIDEENIINIGNKKDKKKIKEIEKKEENNIIEVDDEEKNEEENSDEDPRNKAFYEYNKNNRKINTLNIKYFFSMIIITFTKLYWLVLFFTTGIIYTTQDLSAGIIIYIFIFGITFIAMFHSIIKKLSNFMKEETYFISKIIRYHLIERKNHYNNLKYHRYISFRFLLGYSLILILLFYLYAIFDLFQNGCKPNIWRSCEKDHFSPIFDKGSKAEKIIISISYLLGFYINTQKMGILKAGWRHFLFVILITFDVYIQKIEDYFFKYVFNNRKEYRNLINKNARLKVIVRMDKEQIILDEKNIKKKIENLSKENNVESMYEKYKAKNEERYGELFKHIKNNYQKKNKIISEDEEKEGKNYIIRFLEAIRLASDTRVSLDKTQAQNTIAKGFKKVFEEIIIFLLICTSIIKLSLWSFIYIIISIILISTTKSLKKYYYTFCFIIFVVFAQLLIFISNLNSKTDPEPDSDILDIIKSTFNIPWYTGDIKHGFFYGFGTSKTQIDLIWMDFVDIIILYIYIDYFSYCIYQDSNNIGQTKDINNKINYFNLSSNKMFYKRIKYMKENKLKKLKECIKYNLDINIDDIKVRLGLEPPKSQDKQELIEVSKNKITEEKIEENNTNNIIININENDSNENLKEKLIKTKEKNKNKNTTGELNEYNDDTDSEDENDQNKSQRAKIRLSWKFFFSDLNEILFLSFHNIILIIIIIISMMVSGLLSLFYIIFSLYFIITSNRMYLGEKYYYPKAIKNVLRVIIIIDIGLQILYQIPFFNPETDKKSLLLTILNIIGFNRIINYDKSTSDDIEINKEQIALVFCKAITYFFIGIQILIYSTQKFQEYYLVYVVTRKINLKRKSKMNAFRFNNKRIETMNKSIQLRENMPLDMNYLKTMLQSWNSKLSKIDSSSSHTNLITNKDSKDNINNFGRNKPKKEKIYDEKTVKKYIRKLILDKLLIKFDTWLYQFSVDYTKINPEERDYYERDVIQGKTRVKTFIEKIVDINLDNLKLNDNFNEQEMIEIKKFFVNTKEQLKILEEQKANKKNEEEIKNLDLNNNNELLEDKLKPEENNLMNIMKEEIDKIEKKDKKDKKEKNDKKIEIDLTQDKFKDIENLLKSDLFQRYLKTSYIIKSICINLLSYLSKKFQFLCFFMMILNHIQNSSFISMIYPLSIFCYAIFEYPRPSINYFRFCIIYSIIILAIKYILQLELLVEIFGYENSVDSEEKISIYKEAIKNLEHYKTGFKYVKSTKSYEFFNYIIYDSLIIIFLLINNLLLIVNGLWGIREQEIESIYKAMERVITTKDLLPEDITNLKKFNSHFFEKDRKEGKINTKKEEQKKSENDAQNEEKEKNNILVTYTQKEKSKKYFDCLFPKIRNEKPGNDFYPQYTIGMILVIIYIIIFYTSMVKDVTYSALNKIDQLNQVTNQFSGSMIIYLLIHIFFLCYDRVLYINQNRNNIKYEYIIYDKSTMKPISDNQLNEIKKEISEKYGDIQSKENFTIPAEYAKELKENYSIIYIQTEEFNKILLQKYILHMVIVLAGHAFIFFYAPMTGNYSINKNVFCSKEDEDYEDCNDFNDNKYLIGFYIIYMIYFTFSGMQIKFGFYDMKKKSLLKAKYTTFNKLFNTVFKNIPFLYEIKLAIDWAFTSTSLDLFQWNKYESVYDMVYTTYCNMKVKNISKVGQRVTKFWKASMGGILSFVLVLLLILPILLFSSLNPTNELNNVNSANIKIELGFKDKVGLFKNYTLYESTKPVSIMNFENNEDELDYEWGKYNYSNSAEVKNFPIEQIQRLNFSNTSERNWGMTKPHIINLIDLLNSLHFNDTLSNDDENNDIVEVQLIIDYSFQRYLPVDAKTPGGRHGIIIYDQTNQTKNSTSEILKIREAISNCSTAESTFKNFYSAPIRLTANTDTREIKDEGVFSNLDIYLGFTGCKPISEEESNNTQFSDYIIYNEEKEVNNSYLESYFTFGILGHSGKEGIFFYILSDKISTTTLGYSVVTFYITFILLAGNYVRNFFAGEPSKVTLTEMPECYDIINLCEGIKIARYSYDFEQEENLYYILIELMRSPDYLKYLTKSSVEQFNKRKNFTDRSNDPNCFLDEELEDN